MPKSIVNLVTQASSYHHYNPNKKLQQPLLYTPPSHTIHPQKERKKETSNSDTGVYKHVRTHTRTLAPNT